MKELKRHHLQNNKFKLMPVGCAHFNFFKRITAKYGIVREIGKLSDLIFLKLFDIKNINTTTHVHRIESTKNYFKVHFNFFSTAINQLKQKLIHCYQTQRLQYQVDSNKRQSVVGKVNLEPNYLKEPFLQLGNVVQWNCFIKPEYMSAQNLIIRNAGRGEMPIAFTSGSIQLLTAQKALSVSKFVPWLKFPNVNIRTLKSIKPNAKNITDTFPDVTYNQNIAKSRGFKPTTDAPSFSRQKPISTLKLGERQFAPTFNKSNRQSTTAFNEEYPGISKRIPDQYFHIKDKKALPWHNNLINDIADKSIELTLRKPAVQNIKTVLNNEEILHKEDVRVEKTISAETMETLPKDSTKEGLIREISTVANRVYKIIEKRLLIEKERKGLI